MNREFFDDVGHEDQGLKFPTASKPFYEIVLSRHEDIGRRFKNLLARLRRIFAIEKASLVFYDRQRDCLRLTHMQGKGVLKSGLTLTIPNQHSLLYQILVQGFPIVDNYPELISRNIIEKKILLGPATRSVAVIPLKYDGAPAGLLNLASADDAAFSLYLEGRGEDLVADFITELEHILTPAAGIF